MGLWPPGLVFATAFSKNKKSRKTGFFLPKQFLT